MNETPAAPDLPLPDTHPSGLGTKSTTKCRRCGGTGLWVDRGICFKCNGAGTVIKVRHTPREKELIARWTAWRSYTQQAIDVRGGQIDEETEAATGGHHWDRTARDHARWGLDLLEQHEPQRVMALFSSVAAGRLDAVIQALGEYWRRDNKTRNPDAVNDMLIKGVRSHALDHYSEGWDIIVEATTDEELLQDMGDVTTVAQAVANVRDIVEIHAERAAGIRALAF